MKRNVTFRTSLQYDSLSHPVGEEVALRLKKLIDKKLGMSGDVVIWRDCGWSISYQIEGIPILIVLSRLQDDRFDFYMQIAHEVGILKKIFKKIDGIKVEEKVIEAVNSILQDCELFSEIYWQDKYYDENTKRDQP